MLWKMCWFFCLVWKNLDLSRESEWFDRVVYAIERALRPSASAQAREEWTTQSLVGFVYVDLRNNVRIVGLR